MGRSMAFQNGGAFPFSCSGNAHQIGNGGRQIQQRQAMQRLSGLEIRADEEHGNGHILRHLGAVSPVVTVLFVGFRHVQEYKVLLQLFCVVVPGIKQRGRYSRKKRCGKLRLLPPQSEKYAQDF